MDISSISQISSLPSLLPAKQTDSTQADGSSMFQSIFDSLISNVNETDSSFNGDMVKAAEGELDNPHQLLIDSTKANIALQLAGNVRNNALEAYNEIIKMTV